MYSLPLEEATVDINNPYILKNHILCSSKEISLNTKFNLPNNLIVSDRDIWGYRYNEVIGYLLKDGHLCHINTNNFNNNNNNSDIRLDSTGLLYFNPSYSQCNPCRDINIRMVDPITIKVCCNKYLYVSI